jgi:hypothetical protein
LRFRFAAARLFELRAIAQLAAPARDELVKRGALN